MDKKEDRRVTCSISLLTAATVVYVSFSGFWGTVIVFNLAHSLPRDNFVICMFVWCALGSIYYYRKLKNLVNEGN